MKSLFAFSNNEKDFNSNEWVKKVTEVNHNSETLTESL